MLTQRQRSPRYQATARGATTRSMTEDAIDRLVYHTTIFELNVESQPAIVLDDLHYVGEPTNLSFFYTFILTTTLQYAAVLPVISSHSLQATRREAARGNYRKDVPIILLILAST
ncbi:hypothetical protein WM15_12870 [Burkholderia ubonensis]|nr:hypothetical protein WM15_12870 [Burkholderia ubonensis]